VFAGRLSDITISRNGQRLCAATIWSFKQANGCVVRSLIQKTNHSSWESYMRDAAFDQIAVKTLSEVYDDVINTLVEAQTYPSPEVIGTTIIKHATQEQDPIKVRQTVLNELQVR
jgi:hypothetical protein